jgi:hypothetical protein
VISLAVAAAGWVGSSHPEITPTSNFHHLRDTTMLKSGYLYQLYAYLRTQEKDGDPASLCSEGLLLHPQVGGAVDEWMDLQGHRMRFKTIDLAAGPGDFEFQLNNMMGQNQKGHGQDHRDTGRSSITVTGV